MAAPHENPRKKLKADTNVDGTISSINQIFPKIDNLEYFPMELLLQIFATIDDEDLLNLTQLSCRFGNIAQVAFNDKYKDKYYHFVGHLSKSVEVMERFGTGIKALSLATYTESSDFRDFTNIKNTLAQFSNVTHFMAELGYTHWYEIDVLPKFERLKSF